MLPTLVEGQWPSLKTLSVRGLSSTRREDIDDATNELEDGYNDPETLADLDAERDQIRAALGDGVSLIGR